MNRQNAFTQLEILTPKAKVFDLYSLNKKDENINKAKLYKSDFNDFIHNTNANCSWEICFSQALSIISITDQCNFLFFNQKIRRGFPNASPCRDRYSIGSTYRKVSMLAILISYILDILISKVHFADW